MQLLIVSPIILCNRANYQTTQHNTIQHYKTLHWTTLHNTTLYYTILHYTTLHNITQPNTTRTWQRQQLRSGHVTSQLVFSTSAWPASVYKSADSRTQQDEESCMIWTGTRTTPQRVTRDSVSLLALTLSCVCVCVCVSVCDRVRSCVSEVSTGPRVGSATAC